LTRCRLALTEERLPGCATVASTAAMLQLNEPEISAWAAADPFRERGSQARRRVPSIARANRARDVVVRAVVGHDQRGERGRYSDAKAANPSKNTSVRGGGPRDRASAARCRQRRAGIAFEVSESLEHTAGSYLARRQVIMCQRVTCSNCGKPTFVGCGRHVEAVLGDVPPAARCGCRASSEPRRKVGDKPLELVKAAFLRFRRES
jgi:hypothetical protein